ncbi:uncharacterized protein LOC126426380 [Schistocerca serialis cubense]|uniref:uncharacterized protein LOC126426380 n=1 Tax=Schistocerca serialis cubense TaxID=2023355 RepID=UPI00214F553F|nr:uncharacterized protein LOC126426380 [Schistocerca serialis cubense]
MKRQSPPQQNRRRSKQHQKTPPVTPASAGPSMSRSTHVKASDSSTWDPVAQLHSMLEQDSQVFMSVPEATLDGASQYWAPSYAPSTDHNLTRDIPPSVQEQQANRTGLDVVDEKITTAASPQPLLFISSCVLTVSGSKGIHVGLEVSQYGSLLTVLVLENVLKYIKVKFSDYEWDELCRLTIHIKNHMTTEYYPSHSYQDMYCGSLPVSILSMYDDATLKIKRADGYSIFMHHPTVDNLFNLDMALTSMIERLNRWCPYVQAVYTNIINWLHTCSIHIADIEHCFSMCITPVPKYCAIPRISVENVDLKFTDGIPDYCNSPIALRDICAEFQTCKQQLFSKYCTSAASLKKECTDFFSCWTYL